LANQCTIDINGSRCGIRLSGGHIECALIPDNTIVAFGDQRDDPAVIDQRGRANDAFLVHHGSDQPCSRLGLQGDHPTIGLQRAGI
jgi:hypothetical protein